MSHLARVGTGGRLVIPAQLRTAIGVRAGDAVIIRLTSEGLVITTPERAVEASQAMVRAFVPKERELAEELIAERRDESTRA